MTDKVVTIKELSIGGDGGYIEGDFYIGDTTGLATEYGGIILKVGGSQLGEKQVVIGDEWPIDDVVKVAAPGTGGGRGGRHEVPKDPHNPKTGGWDAGGTEAKSGSMTKEWCGGSDYINGGDGEGGFIPGSFGGGSGVIEDPTWDISQEDWFGPNQDLVRVAITKTGGIIPILWKGNDHYDAKGSDYFDRTSEDIRWGGGEGAIEDPTSWVEGDLALGGEGLDHEWYIEGDYGFIGGGETNVSGDWGFRNGPSIIKHLSGDWGI